MRFFNNDKIKHIIVKNYKLICSRFFISIFFSYIISCAIHVCLIIIFLYKFYYIKKYVCTNTSAIMMFSLQQVDQLLREEVEKKRSSNISCADDQAQKLKFDVYHNHIDKNKDNINENNINKDIIADTDLSSSFIIHHQVKNTAPITDFFSLSADRQRDMNFNNKHNNKICIDIPHIINCTYPKYPDSARVLGIEGKLVVIYNINSLGKVENIRVLSATPVGVFERNVRAAMRHWLYESNQPKIDLIITFKFCLKTIEIFDSHNIR